MSSRVISAAGIALLLLLPMQSAAQEGTPTTHWNIASTGTAEFAAGVAVGADSRPVVVDTVCGTFGAAGCRARAVKYVSDTGVVFWTFTDIAGGLSALAEAAGVAVGSDGNPVMVSTECDSAGLNCLIVAVKINGTTGLQIWRNTSPAAATSSFAKAVTVGVDGHAVVAGGICTEPGTGDCDGNVIKFNGSTGAIMWNVTRTSTYQMLFGVTAITNATNQNNVIVTGVDCAATTQNCNFTTAQLSAATGALVGTAATFNSNEPLDYMSELGWGVRIGTDALPVVTGVSCLAATGCDFRTIKYTGIGLAGTSFNVTYNSTGANSDAAFGGGIAIGGDNLPVIVGASCTTDYPNCVGRIRKLTAAGVQLWNVTYGAATTVLQGVTTGPDGNPVVAGYECSGANCFSRVSRQVLQYITATGSPRTLTINGGQAVADGLTLTFNSVTAAGSTTFHTSNTGFPTAPPALPLGRTPLGGRYFRVATTATITGNTTVCLNYTNLSPTGTETNYRIYRLSGTTWTNTTITSRDTTANWLCGSNTLGNGIYAITIN